MQDSRRWLPIASGGWVAVMVVAGLTLPVEHIDSGLSGRAGAILVAVLAITAVGPFATTRFVVLTRLDRLGLDQRERLIATSYVFAAAPAVYGLVSVVFTGQKLLVLPFGLGAGLALLMVWQYVRERSGAC